MSDDIKKGLVFDYSKCNLSGECIKACPERAITVVDGKPVIDMAKCDLDGICIAACPNSAIKFEG